MIEAFAPPELERFRRSIGRRLGLHFDDSKLGFLGEVLRRRLEATKVGADVYLSQLDVQAHADEIALLGQELTVAETSFFRHAEQYRSFAEIALPDRLRRAQAAGVRLSIVSAGCASGEEPYSLAMTVLDTLADRADAVSILGVDINAAILQRATRGRFSSWVLRDTPPDVQRRWFRAEGRDFVLDDSVRRFVRFEFCNLTDNLSELWRPASHDVVFCRNVLMYFDPVVAQAVVHRIARSLRPEGYLFLGHAETLRGLSNDFHLRHTHGTFYYQRKGELGSVAHPASLPRDVSAQRPTRWDGLDAASTWIDTIRQASERIQVLVEAPRRTEPARDATTSHRRARTREIGPALELLREERFAEALDLVQALTVDSDRDAEVLLLRAVLLTHSGQLMKAERVCQQLLEINELNAEANYLLGLCREGAGDQAGALYHDQVAVYLDPSFAMAHLHLGLLARRMQDLATARRELELAVTLLEREDASRLLLFGGGFSRDALVALCRAKLSGSKGPA